MNNYHPSYSSYVSNGPDLDHLDIGFRVTSHGPGTNRFDAAKEGIDCEAY